MAGGQGGREAGVQLERMPVTMSGPLGCQTSVNVQRRRWLFVTIARLMAYGVWLMPRLPYGFLASIALSLPLMTLVIIMKCA